MRKSIRLLLVLLTIFISTNVFALSLTRVKTWTTEILTHTDLNAEFDNILDHEIVNADVSSTAAITGSKITPTFAADTSPSSDGTYDLGIVGAEWQDVLSDGVIYSDDIKLDGTILILEQADADTDVAGYGQIWVNTATPNELYFTNDAGTDFKLGVGDTLDVITVGTNGDYTTIDAALNAVAAGGTILVSPGTYTEAITFDDDNVSLISTGGKKVTTITQVATNTVTIGTKDNIYIEGFTISMTAADANTDMLITGASDSATSTCVIKDCDLTWAASADLTGAAQEMCLFTDGGWKFINVNATQTHTYAGANAQNLYGLYFGTNVHLVEMDTVSIEVTASSTGACFNACFYVIASTKSVFRDCTAIGNTTHTTTGTLDGYIFDSGTTDLFNCKSTMITTGTGTASGIAAGGSTIYSYGGAYSGATGDSDGIGIKQTAGTYNSYNDVMVGSDVSTSGTVIIKGGTLTGGQFIVDDGIQITDDIYDSTFLISGETQGADAGTVYIGNDTIAFSFTGKHFYQLGDTDLVAGELVSLKNEKIYRTTTKQDRDAIGIYWGITNTKDSLGNEVVVDKEINYYDDKDKKWKTKKDKNAYGKKNNPKQNATASDFARSVATIGDSREIHDTFPLNGAYVTTDNGNIKSGDYLQASDKDGYLEKQGTNAMMNYTIAKAREDINSDTKTGYIYLLQ